MARANQQQDQFDTEAARALYREVIELLESVVEDVGGARLVSAWNNLGLSLAYSGSFEEALPCFEAALERAEEYGNLRGQALAHEGLASVALGRCDAGTALVHGREARLRAQGSGSLSIEARALLVCGDAQRLRSDPVAGDGRHLFERVAEPV